jgi:D-glycero-D-manno-heptose 1,7-bisphosphate phosphatase
MGSNIRPALFLDRDGVINVEKNYVCRPKDFEFVEGIFDLCRKAIAAGMAIVVVTNQAGIGRGYYSEKEFHHLSDWMCAQFLSNGVKIDAVYFCPFHPEYGVGQYKMESFDRKPNPGMILRAEKDLGLDLARSALVGDRLSDIVAAKVAGVRHSIFLSEVDESAEPEPDIRLASLREIVDYLFPN